MGVRQQTIADLERSEQRGTIKVATLDRAAEALDCDLVYFLLPRHSLEASVAAQARKKATEHLQSVAHHSRLEDQELEMNASSRLVDDLAALIADRRGLWSESRPRT